MNEIAAAAREVQRHYPQIYFACHVKHSRRRSTGHDLADQDSVYLGHLDCGRPTSPRHLARHLGIADSTLSAFLKRMEDLGYVERRMSAQDRREVELRLTNGGELAMQATSILDLERLELVLSRLSTADRCSAVDGLRVLAEACRLAREEYEASREEQDGWKRPQGCEQEDAE